MGTAAHRAGKVERAEALLKEALALCRKVGMKRFKGYCLLALGDIAGQRGSLPGSHALFLEGLKTMRELNESESLLGGITDFALLLAQEGRADMATRLLSAARTLCEATQARVAAQRPRRVEAALAEARRSLGESRFKRCQREGVLLSLQQATELALSEIVY